MRPPLLLSAVIPTRTESGLAPERGTEEIGNYGTVCRVTI